MSWAQDTPQGRDMLEIETEGSAPQVGREATVRREGAIMAEGSTMGVGEHRVGG